LQKLKVRWRAALVFSLSVLLIATPAMTYTDPIEDQTNGMVEWERLNKEEKNHAETSMDSRRKNANRLSGPDAGG
jgi:hypothetical protein